MYIQCYCKEVATSQPAKRGANLNNNNLIPLNKRSAEERKYICSLGGKARQKQIKWRKDIKKQLNDYMIKQDIIDEVILEYISENKEKVKKLWRKSKRRYKK